MEDGLNPEVVGLLHELNLGIHSAALCTLLIEGHYADEVIDDGDVVLESSGSQEAL